MVNREDARLLDEFVSPTEVLLWTGRPSRLTYIIGGIRGLIFGLMWGLFDLFFLIAAIKTDSLSLGVVLFLAIHATPFYIGVWGMFVRFMEYKNVIYAYTDQRVIIREGFMGIDYRTVDYARMFNSRVKVSPLEHLQGRGTIIISTGDRELTNRGAQTRRIDLFGIEEPYQVIKELQVVASETPKVSDDISPKDDYSDYYTRFY